MGNDFSNRQCYVDQNDPSQLHAQIRRAILTTLIDCGYTTVDTEQHATRSFVIGPAGRWIFIGDTAGSAKDADPDAFAALSVELSKVCPLVEVHMSDSAAVHLHLYNAGSLIDKYGNLAFPYFAFKTEEVAAEFKGKPKLWAEVLRSTDLKDKLLEIWVQDWGDSSPMSDGDSILSDTAELLGWDPELCALGYTLDIEGLGVSYREVFERIGQSSDGFTELHFLK